MSGHVQHTSAISRREAPEVLQIVPRETREQGIPGARCTRGLVCKSAEQKRTRAYRFSGGNPAFPAQWFTAYFALSPAIGLSCHRRWRCLNRQLDAGVEASGPHDFAVRLRAVRQWHYQRPPHPAPNVRDDRETPLFRDGTEQQYSCFYPAVKRYFGNSEMNIHLRCAFNDLRTRQRILQTARRANQLGRRHKSSSIGTARSMSAVPDGDQMLPHNEMTRCARSRPASFIYLKLRNEFLGVIFQALAHDPSSPEA